MSNRLTATTATLQKIDCCPLKPLRHKESNKSNRSNSIYKIKIIREVREIHTRLIRLLYIHTSHIHTRVCVIRSRVVMEDVAAWLREYLKAFGPCEVSQVRNAARTEGYTKSELRDAKLICMVQTTNNWSRYNKADKWFWSLSEGKNDGSAN